MCVHSTVIQACLPKHAQYVLLWSTHCLFVNSEQSVYVPPCVPCRCSATMAMPVTHVFMAYASMARPRDSLARTLCSGARSRANCVNKLVKKSSNTLPAKYSTTGCFVRVGAAQVLQAKLSNETALVLGVHYQRPVVCLSQLGSPLHRSKCDYAHTLDVLVGFNNLKW